MEFLSEEELQDPAVLSSLARVMNAVRITPPVETPKRSSLWSRKNSQPALTLKAPSPLDSFLDQLEARARAIETLDIQDIEDRLLSVRTFVSAVHEKNEDLGFDSPRFHHIVALLALIDRLVTAREDEALLAESLDLDTLREDLRANLERNETMRQELSHLTS